MMLIDPLDDDYDYDRAEWQLGDYVKEPCPYCGRVRLCECTNGKHRCEKCNWSPEINDFAPVWDD